MSSKSSSALGQLVGQTPLTGQHADNATSNNNQTTVATGIINHGSSVLRTPVPMGNQSSASSSTNEKPKGNICPRCQKPVYFAEEVKAVGQSFHKLCYKCANCKKSINGANFSEHDGNLYDNNCYQRLFGPKGVGYGIGAGALSTGN